MKFTWGHAAIAIPVTIVVVFTSILILSMTDEYKTELVSEDYYAKELAFQDEIDQRRTALSLNTELTWASNRDYLTLGLRGEFDPEEAEGTIIVFRPSDAGLDFEAVLDLDENGNQNFEFEKFTVGKYQIQVYWTVDEKECYLEKNIFVQ